MRLSAVERRQIEAVKDQLATSFGVGQPLRYPFFREKRIADKRMYFLTYESQDAILLVAISDKKTQQETIEKIIDLLPQFKRLIDELI